MSNPPKTSDAPSAPSGALPGFPVYAGLFLVTLSTLLLQLGLTRIFSVIMYYHMAFFVISITLFGIALGGVIVHFLAFLFRRETAPLWMAIFSLLFAASMVYALHRLLGQKIWIHDYAGTIRRLVRLSLLLAVPFTASGVVVALALTLYPARVHRLYGFDLAGAAAGCILFAPLISLLGGPGFILTVAAISALAAVVFLLESIGRATGRIAMPLAGAGFVAVALLAWRGPSMEAFTLRYSRGFDFKPEHLTYDRWNAISRITAQRHQGHAEGVAAGQYALAAEDRQLLLIDTFAATAIVAFDGVNFDRMYFPFHDISYAAHSIFTARKDRRPTRVAVIGVGGGRDILAAKAWGHNEVVGIEINPLCLDALTREFADFAGRPLDWPGVSFVLDEARSYITRSERSFDLIQASLIDTFAATSAGAFVLSENSLYTLEGWSVFLSKLTQDGMISMTRWYNRQAPVESVRLLALARAALEAAGVKDPRRHILMAGMIEVGNPESQPMATLVVKRSPFTPEEVAAFNAWTENNQFRILAAPDREPQAEIAGVLRSDKLSQFVRAHPFRVDPPSDDRPFFFDVLRWRDILRRDVREGSDYIYAINFKPVVMLATTLATLVIMCAVFIVVPFLIEGKLQRSRPQPLHAARRAGIVLYFVMLGLGYMMVEISLIQRFTIFLGHPSHSLTVCLASMLLASGIGSMLADRLFPMQDAASGAKVMGRLNLLITAILIATWGAAELAWSGAAASPTLIRMSLTVLLISPAAFFMGMAFPLAIRTASFRAGSPLSWYWGINGAFSVCASVLTVIIAHLTGLMAAFGCGATCYLVASLAAKNFKRPSASQENATAG